MKTFISRMGENSKLVILGDIDQIDLKLNKGEKCGLEDAINRLEGIPGIGFIEFTEDEIVRDPFLIEIMKRYKTS
jgi:phosphate starvation-inducible PhoH-like protein